MTIVQADPHRPRARDQRRRNCGERPRPSDWGHQAPPTAIPTAVERIPGMTSSRGSVSTVGSTVATDCSDGNPRADSLAGSCCGASRSHRTNLLYGVIVISQVRDEAFIHCQIKFSWVHVAL